MADTITYHAATDKFSCGTDLINLSVINFAGPGGSKVSAYSCNMNVDLDADPQAYAPFSKPKLRPKDNLGDAGWKSSGDNTAIGLRYEAGKKELSDLEQKKTDLIAKPKTVSAPTNPAPAPAKAAPAPEMAALDKQIARKKAELRQSSFEHTDVNGNYSAKNPKNFERIFWKWYGVAALTPEDARSVPAYLEMASPAPLLRRPVLDRTSYYEDVFGRFPVVQSHFEPGPDYFVSPLPPNKDPAFATGPLGLNPRYPAWDQRYFIPHGAFDQTPFGALSTGLASATGLQLNDTVFAIRLDTTDTLSFPFRDSGNGRKVAECSFGTFTALGGDYHPEREGAAKYPNAFLLLYLAFPRRQTAASTLAQFATASNAADFPVMLAFIAQAAADAQAKHSKVVSGDPLKAFETWKKSPSPVQPSYIDVIVQGLSNAGSDFVDRMARKYTCKGPFLQRATQP